MRLGLLDMNGQRREFVTVIHLDVELVRAQVAYGSMFMVYNEGRNFERLCGSWVLPRSICRQKDEGTAEAKATRSPRTEVVWFHGMNDIREDARAAHREDATRWGVGVVPLGRVRNHLAASENGGRWA